MVGAVQEQGPVYGMNRRVASKVAGAGFFGFLTLGGKSYAADNECKCINGVKREGIGYERILYSLQPFVKEEQTKDIAFLLDSSRDDAKLNEAFEKMKGINAVVDAELKDTSKFKFDGTSVPENFIKYIGMVQEMDKIQDYFLERMDSPSFFKGNNYADIAMFVRFANDYQTALDGMLNYLSEAKKQPGVYTGNIKFFKEFYKPRELKKRKAVQEKIIKTFDPLVRGLIVRDLIFELNACHDLLVKKNYFILQPIESYELLERTVPLPEIGKSIDVGDVDTSIAGMSDKEIRKFFTDHGTASNMLFEQSKKSIDLLRKNREK